MKLVHFPESPDPRFVLYVDSPEAGSIYTLENDALVQYGRHTDCTLDSGGEVDFSRGVSDEDAPHLRAIEGLLRDASVRLEEIRWMVEECRRRRS